MGRRPNGLTIRLRDGGTRSFHFLSEERDRHGNMRLYFRRYGKRVRIRSLIGSAEFITEYEALLAQSKPVPGTKPKSLRWLAEQYFASADFARLSERSRYLKRKVLDEVSAERSGDGSPNGEKPFLLMEPRHVRLMRDKAFRKKDKDGVEVLTPEAANQRLKIIRQLFAWGVEALDLKTNPARDVAYISNASEGFHTWTIEEVKHYWEQHPLGTKPRLALDLLLFTGARRSDVVRLGPQMERSDGLTLAWTEAKGRKKVLKERELPILPQLRRSIDACPSGHLAYLTTAFGKPFTPSGFGNWFREQCDRAGLNHCSAHGLRKAGATMAADNGATEFELMALFG